MNMAKDPNAPVEEEHAPPGAGLDDLLSDIPRAFPVPEEKALKQTHEERVKVEEAIDQWVEEFRPATVSRRPEVTNPREWTYVSLRFEAGGHLQRGFRYPDEAAHYGIEVRDL